MKKHALCLSLLLLVGLTGMTGTAGSIPWPYAPFDQTHGLGNHYDEYQNYGGGAYLHDGIDLVTPEGPTRTYSVESATLTHLTYNDPLYSGIMIGQPVANGIGWLYWHINSTTFQFDIGDPVPVNAYIGTTANWPVASFHHTHFNKVQGTGGYPWGWYIATDNPLLYLEPNTDPDIPVFEAAHQGRKFGFRRNQATTALDPTTLSGDVDIISRIYDIVGLPQWKLNPWKIDYWIDGATQSVPVTNSFTLSGLKPDDSLTGVVYSTNSPFSTQGNYDSRVYYFIVTNTDGDGVVESADAPLSWQTGNYRAGDYWVHVRAADIAGNVVTDSMMCTIAGTVIVHAIFPEMSHDFGDVQVGDTATWPMRIQNSGSDWLSIREISSSNAVFQPGQSHLYVPPSGEAIVDVTFSPPAIQVYLGGLTIKTNDPVLPQVMIPLQGRGIDPMGVDGTPGQTPFGITSVRRITQGMEIRCSLGDSEQAAIEIYDVSGRVVRTHEIRRAGAGALSWSWDGRDDSGKRATSGVYYVRLRSGMRSASATGVLVR